VKLVGDAQLLVVLPNGVVVGELIDRTELVLFLLLDLREEGRHRLCRSDDRHAGRGRRRRRRAARVEDEAAVAEGDLVAVAQAQLAHLAAVDEGAVGRVEVAQQEAVAHPLDAAMLFADLAVDQAQRVVGVAPHGGLGTQGELAELAVPEPPHQPGALHLARREHLTLPGVTACRHLVGERNGLVRQGKVTLAKRV
jgi:hypothetical protein